MVLTVLPVPPVTVRPSITLETGERSEDDLTHKLVDILRINQRLKENMEAGAPQLIVEDLWELLQYHVTTYFDNEPQVSPLQGTDPEGPSRPWPRGSRVRRDGSGATFQVRGLTSLPVPSSPLTPTSA